ncbi:class II fructose-bisphosphate aldolase [Candidatus Saccharibacteria bacterium]|nr:class II fructose-bisphosphate aldolase [Candidatus Saccharibacteria bacterium]
MPISLAQAKQNCVNARNAMERARAGHYALGAFNLDNQETLIAVVRAASKLKAPLMVELSHGEVELLGLENIRDMVDNYKHEYGVEIYINLDHSPSIEAAKAAIDMGYEFIHIDISQANHQATEEEIIDKTKEVVAYARRTGALVESEPHYFGGGSNKFTKAFNYKEIQKTFSTPEGAKNFVDATGIDTFAAAVGNLHGSYPVPKRLDLELLKSIRSTINCNISLHGGSGTPLHYFEDAVAIGVTKININSDMRIAYRNTLEKQLRENKTEFAVIKLMDAVINEVQEVVESKIKAFNAVGKAQI